MANELAVKDTDKGNIIPGFGSMASFELSQRVATMLASSSLVPAQFQGKENVANCVIALNMAQRMNADPMMVMQNLYVVYGNPSWSSQFLISTFNTCGRFTAIRYEWLGTEGKDDWGCRAWSVEKETGEKIAGSAVTIAIAKKEGWYDKKGSKWQTMPQQMLMYRAASWFVRAYAPEIAMGLHTQEEIIDVSEDHDGTYKVKEEIVQKANTETLDVHTIDMPVTPQESKATTPDPQPKQTTIPGPGF